MFKIAVRSFAILAVVIALGVTVYAVAVRQNVEQVCGTWCSLTPPPSDAAKFHCLEQCVDWCAGW